MWAGHPDRVPPGKLIRGGLGNLIGSSSYAHKLCVIIPVGFIVEVQIRILLTDKVEVQVGILLMDKYIAEIVSKYEHRQSHFDFLYTVFKKNSYSVSLV
jgi:hypothetical protein